MVHDARFGACDEHDLGALRSQPLGPFRAVGEQDEWVLAQAP
ncbi:hypothetical protein [Streptodolium elevatio]|uniref:Uncharacterized protein n=1 Tax=Streptodolium elevatio TaxID=3157996 RepID=A0ABV3DS62_9ACTN